jgi:hypothetical protein
MQHLRALEEEERGRWETYAQARKKGRYEEIMAG